MKCSLKDPASISDGGNVSKRHAYYLKIYKYRKFIFSGNKCVPL
ncbi:hypothetical protein AvCA_08190 [Azotobacter vinelandii CA]|uniref:Uncharacterized protein n=2 Tax=Azotobacter vinelandii TaxID=354 RepID=C1DMN4_AZOVD|nr:hypothetical protein Avin_08190 [Azotobacter vinelandii DJ]AGK17177.1 hypothetical protein AvCA_08190 [Azotobacter vinelandii CA]AGK19539.1 hypothetical protein AvCA6_08190 [Azotobacter vinelandii CA6]